jgi:basic membrane lipoprotein Med (substrate-binding protein (PBP1-ABC) superfamily)
VGRLPAWMASGRTRWYLAGAAGAVLALLLTWILWPTSEPAPRERRYRDVTACLLTDGEGITGPVAAPVWAGMQEASVRTLAQVQFVAVPDERNAAPYLAGLAQGSCDVVVAVGEGPLGAVAESAGRFPSVRFVVVDGETSGANVSIVDGTGDLRTSVSRIVESMVGPSAGN